MCYNLNVVKRKKEVKKMIHPIAFHEGMHFDEVVALVESLGYEWDGYPETEQGDACVIVGGYYADESIDVDFDGDVVIGWHRSHCWG